MYPFKCPEGWKAIFLEQIKISEIQEYFPNDVCPTYEVCAVFRETVVDETASRIC